MGRRTREPLPPAIEGQEDPFPGMNAEQQGDGGFDPATELNDPNQTDLHDHEPTPIGTYGHGRTAAVDPLGFGGPQGFDPPAVSGRPTSPRIWAASQLHPNVTQLRVWKIMNGNPVHIGPINAGCNEEEFVTYFFDSMPKPGEGEAVFKFRPMSMDGTEIGVEIVMPAISEHHVTLKRIRQSKAGGMSPNPMPLQPDMSPLTRMLEMAQVTQNARVQQLETQAHADRQAAIAAQERMAAERAELAARGYLTIEATTERMMKAEEQRATSALDRERHLSESAIAQTKDATAMILTFQQQAAEREREAYQRRMDEEDRRRERERQDYEQRMERERREAETKSNREREEWERRWEREKLEMSDRRERERIDREREREQAAAAALAQEQERQRQHDVRLAEMNTAAQREREHAERMMAINLTREKGDSIEGMLSRGTAIGKMLGIDVGGIVKRMVNPEEPEEGPDTLATIIEGVSKLAPVGAEIMRDLIRARTSAMQPVTVPGAPIVAQPLLTQALPVGGGPAGGGGGQQPQPATVPGQPVAGQPVAAQPSTAPPGPTADDSPAPGSTLPLKTQKDARVALRDLVRKVRVQQQDKWLEIITVALTNEPKVYHYLKEVSIRYGLKEAGADDTLIEAILAHPGTALIPADVPRG